MFQVLLITTMGPVPRWPGQPPARPEPVRRAVPPPDEEPGPREPVQPILPPYTPSKPISPQPPESAPFTPFAV